MSKLIACERCGRGIRASEAALVLEAGTWRYLCDACVTPDDIRAGVHWQASAPSSQEEPTARRLVYGEEARSHALGLWAEGHLNTNGQRPWREEYQAAVREVSPALDRYGTVDELVSAYYEADLHDEFERAAQLADGRILNYATVEDAAFWTRYMALTRTDGVHLRIND
jgi:hypothetical protein